MKRKCLKSRKESFTRYIHTEKMELPLDFAYSRHRKTKLSKTWYSGIGIGSMNLYKQKLQIIAEFLFVDFSSLPIVPSRYIFLATDPPPSTLLFIHTHTGTWVILVNAWVVFIIVLKMLQSIHDETSPTWRCFHFNYF